MRYGIISIGFIFALVLTAQATTIHVPTGQPTIQDGINAAVNGDTVLVAPGTYVENIDFVGKAITVESSDGADVTTIDGNQTGSVVTFSQGETLLSILDGFKIMNGSGNAGYSNRGGGIYCSGASPLIRNNIISYNEVLDDGGGIYCSGSPHILNNVISSNYARGEHSGYNCGGGGVYCSGNALIEGNTISGNSANKIGSSIDGYGGGIETYFSSPTIKNNTVSGNSIFYGYGGGLCCKGGAPIITGNLISNNYVSQAWYGGGLYLDGSSPIMTNNTIANNHADSGGGMYSMYSTPEIINCTIVENWCSLYGSGIFFTGDIPVIKNTILWDNESSQLFSHSYTADVSFSCIEGGYPGTGNIDDDPLFADSSTIHLTFPSPCKDTGDNSSVTEPFDFEGDPRITDGTVDMGADEFYRHLYYTGDATPGGSVALKFVGDPGTAQVGLIIGFNVFDPPIPGAYGDWYMKQPILLVLGLGPIPLNGVYILPGTLPPIPAGPYTVYFQAMIAMKLTNLCTMNVE